MTPTEKEVWIPIPSPRPIYLAPLINWLKHSPGWGYSTDLLKLSVLTALLLAPCWQWSCADLCMTGQFWPWLLSTWCAVFDWVLNVLYCQEASQFLHCYNPMLPLKSFCEPCYYRESSITAKVYKHNYTEEKWLSWVIAMQVVLRSGFKGDIYHWCAFLKKIIFFFLLSLTFYAQL